jgi:hypothetical protein
MLSDKELRASVLDARIELKRLLNQGATKLEGPCIFETQAYRFFTLPRSFRGDSHTGYGVLLKDQKLYALWLKNRVEQHLGIYLSDETLQPIRLLAQSDRDS